MRNDRPSSQALRSGARYDCLSRALHWITAAIIIYVMAVGLCLPLVHDPNLHALAADINVSLGTLLIPVFALRYVWRFFRDAPPPDPSIAPLQRKLAHMTHELFYLAILLMLATGVLMMDRSYRMMAGVEFDAVVTDPAVRSFFGEMHHASTTAVGLLLLLHVGAVLKHQWLDGRDILARMRGPARTAAAGMRLRLPREIPGQPIRTLWRSARKRAARRRHRRTSIAARGSRSAAD